MTGYNTISFATHTVRCGSSVTLCNPYADLTMIKRVGVQTDGKEFGIYCVKSFSQIHGVFCLVYGVSREEFKNLDEIIIIIIIIIF
jgi:hypothetical protein